MLVSMKELLQDARARGYGVGAYNVTTPWLLTPYLNAAEKKKAPLILGIAEVSYPTMDIERFAPALIKAAQDAQVPVVVHLDHGASLGAIVKALRFGFSSIMYDGSMHPFEKNVETTRLVRQLCDAARVSLEAELGSIGGAEASDEVQDNPRSFFTPVDKVKEFVERGGADALAISIGNVHGFYQGEPQLDFPLLEQIAQQTSLPLVLHGGSGLSDQDFQKAIAGGIAKINFYTASSKACFDRLTHFFRQTSSYVELCGVMDQLIEATEQTVMRQMDVFGTSGKA